MSVFSQNTAEKYLSKLPVIPEYICGASEETQSKFTSKLYSLKTEINVSLADEKEAKEKAQANAQPRFVANTERFKQIAEEIQLVEDAVNAISKKISKSFIEQQCELEVKYAEILDPLYDQQKAAINSRESAKKYFG